MKCPDCKGKRYYIGQDPNYPLDMNVALVCRTCKGRGSVTDAVSADSHPPTEQNGD